MRLKWYQKLEISELASFISGMEFHPMSWRAAHPYVLVDRLEDVTPTERLHMDINCNRDIILYGYLRGCDIEKEGTKVHIAGVGDFPLAGVTSVAELPPLLHIDVTYLKIDITEHSNHDEQTRSKEERIGSYLKFKVCDVPSELVNNRDPCQPILVGGISRKEQTVGFISARFERHVLHTKSLKTNDPIIVSVGWRRYKTRPIYALEDLHEILDFTPEDKPCTATFWGPFATPGTGVVAVQSLADNKAAFRILATGLVLDGYWIKRGPTCNLLRKVHCIYNPLMKSPEPRDRVWTAEMKESEKSEAHVVWVSGERKIAPGDLRKDMSKSLEEKLKLPCQKRKTDEQWRAVMILVELYYGMNREFREALQKQEEDIRNNIPRGRVDKFFKRRDGKRGVIILQ